MTRGFDVDGVPGALNAETGKLERPVDGALLRVPAQVWIEDECLHWRMGRLPSNLPRYVEPGSGLLTGFLDLADELDETIEAFARRWGVLGICKHGFPHTHNPFAPWHITSSRTLEGDAELRPDGSVLLPVEFKVIHAWCRPLGQVETGGQGGYEPLRHWRTYSRLAHVIVRGISALHCDGEEGARLPKGEADFLTSGTLTNASEQVPIHWWHLDAAISRWLALGNVRPFLRGNGDKISVQFGTHCVDDNTCGLFGALAAQLLMSAAGSTGIAQCAGCLEFFPTSRNQPFAKRRFCPTCRDAGAPQKLAARDYRRRGRSRREQPRSS